MSADDKADLYKEIKVLKLLGNHPCAVHMSDYFEDDSGMFIMMDYMKGGELFDRIVRKEKYTEVSWSLMVVVVIEMLVVVVFAAPALTFTFTFTFTVLGLGFECSLC